MMASPSILIVEDEGIVSRDIESSLESLGYVVAGKVTSGREAISNAEITRPDLVLMDIRLEGEMDGIQTAEIIDRRFKIPVVYLTAYADRPTLERAKLTGPFGYIVKPFEDRDLEIAIEMALYKHRMDSELEFRAKFEELIAGISTNFVNLDAEEIDEGINAALEEIAQFAGADRSYIFQFKEGSCLVYNTHEWCAPGIEPWIENLKGVDVERELPSFLKIIKQDRNFDVPSVSSLSANLSAEKEYFQKEDIKSLAAVPMLFEGDVVGFLGFNSVKEEKRWSPDIISLLRITGEIIANALARKRDEEKIRKRNQDLALINELNDAVNSEASLDAILSLLADRTREIFSSHGAAVYLLSEDGKSLVMQNASFPGWMVETIEMNIGEAIPGVRIPLQPESVYAQALEGGGAQLIHDQDLIVKMAEEFTQNKSFRKLIPRIIKLIGIRSVVNVPLMSGEEIIGLVDIFSGNTFSREDLARIEAISLQLTTIIKHKQAEEALRASEERYRNMFELSPEAIVLVDKTGKVLEVNDRLEEWLGYHAEDVVGKYLNELDFIPAKSRSIISERFARRMQGEDIPPYELDFITKDGRHEVGRILANALRDSKGNTTTDMILISNITLQKRAEKSIKRKLVFEEGLAFSSQMLVESVSLEQGVQAVLEEVLRVMDADHVHIFKNFHDVDGKLCTCLQHEAVAKGMKPGLENPILQHIAYEDFSDSVINAMLVGEGYGGIVLDFPEPEREFLTSQGILSTLLIPIRTDYESWGFLSVDDCRGERNWEKEEFKFLQTIASLISSSIERNRARNALKKSEEKYRNLVENTRDVIYSVDASGVMRYISPNVTGWGYEQDEIEGKPFADFVHPDDAESVMVDFVKTLETGADFPTTFRLKLKNGEYIYAEEVGKAVTDEEGNVKMITGAIRDVTQRKKAEDKLKEANKIINQSSSVAFTWKNSKGWPVEFVSDNVRKVFGYSVEEFTSGSVLYEKCIHPDDLERVAREVEQNSKRGKREFTHEPYRIITKNGDVKWVSDWTFIVRGKKGDITHYKGIIQNITDRKKAEEALQESEEKYKQLTERLKDVVFSLSVDGRLLYCSPAVKEFGGYDAEEEIGKFVGKYFAEKKQLIGALKLLKKVAVDKEGATLEMLYKPKNKEPFWVEISGQPVVKNGKVSTVQCVMRDISERKKAQRKEREYFENMRFLSKTALEFVELPLEADLYEYIGIRLKELIGESFVVINSYDPVSQLFTVRSIHGASRGIQATLKLLDKSIVDTTFPITSRAKTGLTRKRLELVEGGIFELTGGYLSKVICESVERLMRSGQVYAMGFARKNELYGSVIILLPEGSKLENKKVVETLITQASVALQRRITEDALVESEKHYRTVVDTMQEGMGVVDPDESIIYANPAFGRMLGFAEEELLGKKIYDLIPPSAITRLKDETAKRQKGISSEYELQMIHKTGEIRDIRVSAVPLASDKGEYRGSVGVLLDVTEQKQAVQALRDSEERYRAFTEEALVGIYIYQKGRYRFVNQSMEKITGYTRDELLSLDPCEYGLPMDRDSLQESSGNRGSGQSPDSEFTVEVNTKDGQHAFLEVRVRLIPYGDSVAYLGNCIDITQRVRQREQLRLAKQEWERTFDSISDLVMIVYPDGRIQKVNKSVLRYTLLPFQELFGKHFLEVFHLSKEQKSEYFRGEFIQEYFEITDPQSEMIFSVSVSPLRDASGKTVAMVNVARNITDMRRMAQALMESEMQFRGLAESAKDLIFSVAADGSVLYLNPAFENILGFRPDEFIGTNLRDHLKSTAISPDIKKQLVDYLSAPEGEFSIPLFEVEVRDEQNRQRILEISAGFFSNQFIGIARDVTERKLMEQQLTRASKLASIGVLAAGLGHQVNNPLASLLATSTVLKEVVSSNGEIPEESRSEINIHLESIEQQLDRTHEIVSGLLEFAQEKPVDVAPHDINDIVHQCLQFLSQHLSFKNISLKLELGEGMSEVMVDQEATKQALLNLLQNAMEAMEGAGNLTVKTEWIREGSIAVSVSNDGPTIPEEDKDKIFELLYSTKTAQKGTGLGLPVSAMLLEHFGGHLYLKDSSREQTTFIMELPVKKGDNFDR